MKWRYSLRWKLPHRPCPGPHELVSEVVEAGQPAPESVMARWVAGVGYAVCVDYIRYYNTRRISLKFNGLSPVEYRLKSYPGRN